MNRRRTKTRSELRREALRTLFLSIVLVALVVVLTVRAIGVWAEHPGEQMVSGSEYIASLQE
jgi:hypothetical protein